MGRAIFRFIFLLWIALLIPLIDPAGAQQNWEREWEKTLAAAKKEGQVNVYITFWGAILDSGQFQKSYPDIKVVGVAGRTPEIPLRLLSEHRAGKYLADVYIGGVPNIYPLLYRARVLDHIRPLLILPEVVDESKWWRGKHQYQDPEGEYAFRFTSIPMAGTVHYNTHLVNPREFKSHWDFVHPKWKGKILAADISEQRGPGSGSMRFFYYHPELGPKFIKALFGEMDMTLFRDYRQATNWLAQGRYAICFFCSDVDQAKGQGLPVDSFKLIMKEGLGLSARSGNVALVRNAPHPSAARVFVNWLLSRAGQLTLQKAIAKSGSDAPDSLRIDIPKDDVLPENRRVGGVKYLDLDEPGRTEMEPALKAFKEALAQAQKGAGKMR